MALSFEYKCSVKKRDIQTVLFNTWHMNHTRNPIEESSSLKNTLYKVKHQNQIDSQMIKLELFQKVINKSTRRHTLGEFERKMHTLREKIYGKIE